MWPWGGIPVVGVVLVLDLPTESSAGVGVGGGGGFKMTSGVVGDATM